jgi:hypothetical protein
MISHAGDVSEVFHTPLLGSGRSRAGGPCSDGNGSSLEAEVGAFHPALRGRPEPRLDKPSRSGGICVRNVLRLLATST